MKTILNWRTLCAPVVIGLLAMMLLSLHSAPNAQAADTGWRGPTADAADTGGDGDGFRSGSGRGLCQRRRLRAQYERLQRPPPLLRIWAERFWYPA